MKSLKGTLVCSSLFIFLLISEPAFLWFFRQTGIYTYSLELFFHILYTALLLVVLTLSLFRFWKNVNRQKLRESVSEEISLLRRHLNETESRFQSLVANVPGVTFRASAETWTMLFMSSEMETLSGYSADRFVGENGKPFESIMHPDDVMALRTCIGGAIEKRENFNIEYRIIHRDGTIKWVYEKGLGIFDSSGKLLYLDGVIVDISDIRSLKTYLQSIIDSMASLIVGVDMNGEVVLVNKQAENRTGLKLGYLIGRSFDSVFPSLSPLAGRIREAIGKKEIVHFPRSEWKSSGVKKYEEISLYPLRAEEFEGAVIRIDDITEKTRLEEIMVRNDRMLSVGGLAAGMAHELNNPLAGVIQTTNVLARRLDFSDDNKANIEAAARAGIHPDQLREYARLRDLNKMFETINESGRRMSEIINDMIGFARTSDNERSSNNLAEIVDRSLKLAETDFDIGRNYNFASIGIEKQYENDMPPVVCDKGKIHQVVLNLLRNCSQVLRENRISDPAITIRLFTEQDGSMASLEIEDNGPGVNEEIIDRIFEPFFTTRPEGSGTGLGLSISYFIVKENHNGELTVRNRPGSGAVFKMSLPVIV